MLCMLHVCVWMEGRWSRAESALRRLLAFLRKFWDGEIEASVAIEKAIWCGRGQQFSEGNERRSSDHHLGAKL